MSKQDEKGTSYFFMKERPVQMGRIGQALRSFTGGGGRGDGGWDCRGRGRKGGNLTLHSRIFGTIGEKPKIEGGK